MSWSINVMGKGSAVAVQAKTELDRYTCTEPEESVKAHVRDIIVAVCEAGPSAGFTVTGEWIAVYRSGREREEFGVPEVGQHDVRGVSRSNVGPENG